MLFGLLFAFAAFGGCGKAADPGEKDASAFPFDDPATVQYGYGYTDMRYPYEDSRPLVQLYAADAEGGARQFDCEVAGGSLAITTKEDLSGRANICFRVYSPLFDGRAPGSAVRVSFEIDVDPQASPDMFFACNDERGDESSNKIKIPKAGKFSKMTFVTAIGTSAGYYRNNPDAGNRGNVMFMFLRLGANERFAIDKIDFEFL